MMVRRHAFRSIAPFERLDGETVATRIQQVLAARGLTLSDVSRESRSRYAENSAYRIPHHFYADVRIPGFSPRMEQILAFSAITSYRLVDWLAVFGFHLDRLSPLAAALPSKRTVLLDASVYDDQAEIEWFRNKSVGPLLQSIAPLGHFLEPGPRQQLKSLLPHRPSPFLYAKVGRQDALAFPDLVPGSIVRVDTRRLPQSSAATPKSLYLVEHHKGLACCRLHIAQGDLVVLRSTELPYAEVALQLSREAHILGTLDLELRFLESSPVPEVPRDLAVFWKPLPLPPPSARRGFGELIVQSRRRSGLSLREASVRSRRVADRLRDDRFFCARATLAGYERTGTPPRHIHKILTLCVVYPLAFSEVLAAAGWKIESLRQDPIPRAALGHRPDFDGHTQPCSPRDSDSRGFLSGLLEQFEDIPFFLRNSLARLTGLPDLSLRDILWLGGHRASFHPYLASAVLAAIDGRERKPPSMGKQLLRDEPLYVLLRRDGSYLCARCTLEDNTLVIHPFSDGFERPLRLRNGVDAEVVGKVAALVRKL